MIFVKLSFHTTLLTTNSEFKWDNSILSNSAVRENKKCLKKIEILVYEIFYQCIAF